MAPRRCQQRRGDIYLPMPIFKHLTGSGAHLYWDSEDGERWRIHSVRMHEGGVFEAASHTVATHRLFVAGSGKRRLYTFRVAEPRDDSETWISRQFETSEPLKS